MPATLFLSPVTCHASPVTLLGWVGCNFDLHRIPIEARIAVVRTMACPRRRSGVAPDSDLRNEKYGDRRDACPTIIVPPEEVREKFQRVKPLKDISVKQRGWTLDVLNIVRRLTDEKRQRAGALQNASRSSRVIGQRASVLDCGGPPPLSSAEFTNEDVHAHARELEQLHPDNRHVRDKIRQPLQVLRDAKLLVHVGSGVWRLP